MGSPVEGPARLNYPVNFGVTGIGEAPFCIEHLWQFMYRAYFYPPGREKMPGSI